jgi:UDP-hydrolysing UDP-N-acetyl-D-glucosamine 2-epimerase
MERHFNIIFINFLSLLKKSTVKKVDLVIVLGDRYEAILNAVQAIRQKKTLAHLHGGEKTLGSMDEHFRHAITKLSHYHFASAAHYKGNIIKLGENPANVYNAGALGVERIKILRKSPVKIKDQIVMIYHPDTVSGNTKHEIHQILMALKEFSHLKTIFYMPNKDPDYQIVKNEIRRFLNGNNQKLLKLDSGDDYIKILEESKMIIGNSSSGIIEAPTCRTPTLNIGDRQKGRVRAASVLDCPAEKRKIICAMEYILSGNFKNSFTNPYEKENTAQLIIDVLSQCDLIHKKV